MAKASLEVKIKINGKAFVMSKEEFQELKTYYIILVKFNPSKDYLITIPNVRMT